MSIVAEMHDRWNRNLLSFQRRLMAEALLSLVFSLGMETA
jgi:hypothetical protein